MPRRNHKARPGIRQLMDEHGLPKSLLWQLQREWASIRNRIRYAPIR